MTFVIGLTGGIGSGKSTVADVFAHFKVPVIDTDILARMAVQPKTKAYLAIKKKFGPKVLLPNGELNRRYLRELIFNHASYKKWLEHLLHPIIFNAAKRQIKKVRAPYCVVVIPLLAEHFSLYQRLVDYVIVVDAPQKLRLERTHLRDNSSKSQILKMMRSQARRKERLKIADAIIQNHGNKRKVQKQVKALHEILCIATS